jgi:predicted nucleic acid-binding Zn ribbon protein
VKCIICGQEIPQDETEIPFLSDSVPKICEDYFDIIAEGKKNRR